MLLCPLAVDVVMDDGAAETGGPCKPILQAGHRLSSMGGALLPEEQLGPRTGPVKNSGSRWTQQTWRHGPRKKPFSSVQRLVPVPESRLPLVRASMGGERGRWTWLGGLMQTVSKNNCEGTGSRPHVASSSHFFLPFDSGSISSVCF